METTFTTAFTELLGMRTHYENLRTTGAPFAQRALAIDALHAQRAMLASIRATQA